MKTNEEIRQENRAYYHKMALQMLRLWRWGKGQHVESTGLVPNVHPAIVDAYRVNFRLYRRKALAYSGICALDKNMRPAEIAWQRQFAARYRRAIQQARDYEETMNRPR